MENYIDPIEMMAPKKVFRISADGKTTEQVYPDPNSLSEISRKIIGETNDDSKRNSMLMKEFAKRYGTGKDNKYAMDSMGELYSRIKKSTPHTEDWYKSMNDYREAADAYKTVIGDTGLDYYNNEVDKFEMIPNHNKEKLSDMIDTNDNGKIEKSEMENFTDSLNDYMTKNPKGRDDIPVTTRR